MTDALPCPFCGHHEELYFTEGGTFRWLAYSCRGCGVGNETRKQTMGDGTQDEWEANAKIDALKEWNTRTVQPVQPSQARELSEAVQNLIDATEGLMAWQVKNVKVWHNGAYDTAELRVKQIRAAINAKETK